MVSDAELGVDETGAIRVRAIEINDEGLALSTSPETQPNRIAWTDIVLIVTGRLVSTRIELNEEKGKRAENRIVDSSQFFSDEVVFEFYATAGRGPFRISANSFDFSCLGEKKGLVSVENMTSLLDMLQTRSPNMQLDQ